MRLAFRFRGFALCGAALVLWTVTALGAWSETRVALIIGNSAYQSVKPLPNPINDALDMSVALEGLGFEVILGTDWTQAEMRQGVTDFAQKAQTADVALFYYAGHGFQISGQNYLLPVDAAIRSADDLQYQTVPFDLILASLDQSPAIKLIFLDACRNNPLDENAGTLPEASDGLARAGNDANFLLSYATQPDNVAYDGQGRNSYFTEAILNHIYVPGQDISDLMIAVRRDVLAATGGRQIPWENSSLTRQFQFDPSPPTASEETLLWQIAAAERDPQLLELYNETFPQGAHAQEVALLLQGDIEERSLTLLDEDTQAERMWQLARRSRLRPLLEYYVDRFPDGQNVDQARALIDLIPDQDSASPGRRCERLATHPRDATGSIAGVPFGLLQRNAPAAVQACSAASVQSPDLPHYTALLARATAALGDIDRAAQLYRTAASRGDLRAQVSLAQLYENGLGVPQNQAQALALYEAAASGGSLDAMVNLAFILSTGTGIKADPARAIALTERAAKAGSAEATYNLGALVVEGKFGELSAALPYFERAAAMGYPDGYRAGSILLDSGSGIKKDPKRAAIFLLRAIASDDGTTLRQVAEGLYIWSPETIRATQSRLAKAGYYTGAIDGLAGPNFNRALRLWRNGGFKPDVLADS